MASKTVPKTAAEIFAAMQAVPGLQKALKEATNARNGCMNSFRASLKKVLARVQGGDVYHRARIGWNDAAEKPYIHVTFYPDKKLTHTQIDNLVSVLNTFGHDMGMKPELEKRDDHNSYFHFNFHP